MSSSKRNQKGGSSDWMHSFYAHTAIGNNAAITRAGLKTIDQSPMFNPLSANTVFPTESTGIVPTGLYLAGAGPAPPTEMPMVSPQMGGGNAAVSWKGQTLTLTELKTLCNRLGASCKSASGEQLTRAQLIHRIKTKLH